jgi:O-antigen/teichoic acid export membrane protein
MIDRPALPTSSAPGASEGQVTITATRIDDRALTDHARKERSDSARARIVQNLSALGIGQIFTWVSAAGLAVVVPQQLGDQHFGRMATAASLTDVCGLMASLGVSGYLLKEVARRDLDARSEVVNALVMRIPMAVAATIVAVSAAALLGYDPLTSQLVYLLCLNMTLSALSSVLGSALHGLQQMRQSATIDVLSKGILFGMVALLLYLGYGVVGVLIAYNVAGVFTLSAYLYVLGRRGYLRGRLDLRLWRVILFGSLPFFTWQSAHMIYAQVDVILLAQFTRDAVVGWYGAAYRIVSIPVFIPTIIAAAVYPALSRAAWHDVTEFRLIAQRSVRAVLLLTIPIALGTMVTGERLIEFFRYPEEFRRSVPLIVILATHMPLVGISTILGFVLVARDRQQTLALCGIVAAILNPSLNLLLIPYYHAVFDNGAIGAAFATLATELFMTAMSLWLLRGTVLGWRDLIFGARCLASGLLMSGVVWLMLDFFLPLTVLVGALVYASSSWIVGTLTSQDIRTLLMYVSRRRATSHHVSGWPTEDDHDR